MECGLRLVVRKIWSRKDEEMESKGGLGAYSEVTIKGLRAF